jgi:hypothetical protein
MKVVFEEMHNMTPVLLCVVIAALVMKISI